jgi:hypothetical protein
MKVLKSLDNLQLMLESLPWYLLKNKQFAFFILNKQPILAPFGTAGNWDVVPYFFAGNTPQ